MRGIKYNTVTRLCYYSRYGTREHRTGSYCLRGVPRMSTFLLIAITIIFTLIGKPRVQKTTFFFCLRRRMVSSFLRETKWSHWSRVMLRIPADKKMLNGQLKTICTTLKWCLVCISNEIYVLTQFLMYVDPFWSIGCFIIPLLENFVIYLLASLRFNVSLPLDN